MADDAEKTKEGNISTENLNASGDAEQQADDVEHTAVKIDEVMRDISKENEYGRMQTNEMDEEQVIVDRSTLEAILDVSSRLKDIQKKSRVSMSTLALAHETYKDKQVNKFNK